ncbi:MAG: protein translocase subunit SecD [bacterium]|nr:protein translocase subunit SecD [bacterium]MCM1410827.1 protein translocase subunit SecD [Lachnospiraceae bacterium]
MTRSKAIIILIVMILALAGITYVDFAGVDASGRGSASDIKLGLDLAGGVSITYQVVGEEEPSSTDMADTISKLQQRVWNYSTEAVVYQEGADRINIEIPGVSDANAILQELGRPGALYFIKQTGSDGTDNYTTQLVMGEDGSYGYEHSLNRSLEEIIADGGVVLEGTDVADASAATRSDSMQNQQIVVVLTLNEEGKAKFEEATREAYNGGVNSKTIAIYYDGNFVSVPTVSAVISDGNAQISGSKTFEEAEKLASTIRIGGLSLELEELHSKVVGAQLGVDAIETSLKAGAIGLVIVVVFMIAVYFISGLAASLALGMYVAMIVMLLNGFDMTLTLSGIAGIILSIGMAVDANVIIFARIREELATGKTVKSSMQIGFDKALSAIIDGNITTLIAAAVLWILGPGTVKGFAQTLALGIVLSMFTALVLTKLIMSSLYTLGLKDAKWYGIGKERKPLNVLKHRKWFFGVSSALIIAGFVVMGVYMGTTGDALNLSLEFKGGTATTVTFAESKTLEQVNSEIVPYVEEIIGSGVQIQTVQDSNEIIFKSDSLSPEKREQLNQMFKERFGVEQSEIISETISSTISDEMTRDTIIAVIVAIICMLIYIRIRFSDFRFGAAGVMALLHDVLVVLAFYAAARVSVSNTFIACMLTIVGYSINATIVIFDRVRENIAEMGKKESLEDVLNRSITQTLSRSIFTSLTTFIMVAVLYILGVTSIRDFALPLMVGILCGAYSSVCLAGPVWYVLRRKFPPKAKV